MIQANDLRIGNVLKYFIGEDGLDWQETTIDAQDILWCQENNENFNKVHKPVELTPEVLAAVGFKDMDGEFCPAYQLEQIEIEILPDDSYYARIKWDKDGASLFLADIKSLHQLQNLYFALTGKELEYKPK